MLTTVTCPSQACQSRYDEELDGWKFEPSRLPSGFHSRIRYGSEKDDWGAEKVPCHDCRVIKGEFHVPSCDVEECPVCGDQLSSCDCPFDERGQDE